MYLEHGVWLGRVWRVRVHVCDVLDEDVDRLGPPRLDPQPRPHLGLLNVELRRATNRLWPCPPLGDDKQERQARQSNPPTTRTFSSFSAQFSMFSDARCRASISCTAQR
jgi:hypothetical protein